MVIHGCSQGVGPSLRSFVGELLFDPVLAIMEVQAVIVFMLFCTESFVPVCLQDFKDVVVKKKRLSWQCVRACFSVQL